MTSTYKTVSTTPFTRKSSLPPAARKAYILNALLAELELVRRDELDIGTARDMKQALKHLCRMFEHLGLSIPQEYAASRAGDVLVGSMMDTITKVERMYLNDLNGMSGPSKHQ